jgi:glucosylceramidase
MDSSNTHLLTRRTFLALSAATSALGIGAPVANAASNAMSSRNGQWVVSTRDKQWVSKGNDVQLLKAGGAPDFTIMRDETYQTIDGFGACFSELGGAALNALNEADRQAIMRDLFSESGTNLGYCRLPIGANDFSRDWYSYNETDNDFEMTTFSIVRDKEIQIPFIKAAMAHRPDLKLWASPWSPPTWMKTNHHYAMVQSAPNAPPNGLGKEQVGMEGQDYFVQQPRYFAAYALYFRKFIEAYRHEGINISMVAPQNEFNSAQPFPSCCWTPDGLTRFIPYLGREMSKVDVSIMFGTLERGDPALFNRVYSDPKAGPYIKAVGAQWAGRKAIPLIHYDHPELKVFQTEQECGDGKNDWRYARHTWAIMKEFMHAGASVYDYWNIALPSGGVSRWGWAQNSLVTVNVAVKSFKYNYDYFILKHVSAFVKPGAKRIKAASWTGFENVLAFLNPDGTVVVVVQNDLSTELPITWLSGDKTMRAILPPDSFNTFVV